MSQPAIRAAQLADQIRDFLAEKVARDFTGYLITITQVTLSPDLQKATVWVTSYVPEEKELILNRLRKEGSRYQRELHRSLRRHHGPKLHFQSDYSVEDGERIDQLLK